ncbi:hypothetical protein PM8797T_15803 [Gimesia maris DSM 8797]|nr:hypothetical protein PM8797T_15803 [Gimesia maris DSM 8797]
MAGTDLNKFVPLAGAFCSDPGSRIICFPGSFLNKGVRNQK